MEYRSEIDGLRAAAVLSVIAYHYGKYLPGGFVGVDVFFVISGFLITGQIMAALQSGTLKLGDFYLRRAKRILPALFTTLILCFALGSLLFPPEEFANLGASIFDSLFSVSNFYFFHKTNGYFAQSPDVIPLLHTWSLSIEGQFYLTYPIGLVVAYRLFGPRSVPVTLLVLGAISMALNLSFQDGHSILVAWSHSLAHKTSNGRETIFYLSPCRAFEFYIGALIFWLPSPKREMSDGIMALGLAAIAWAAITYTNKTIFPSINALAPCIGAAMVIYAGKTRYVGLLLTNPLAARIGKISYSLYLVHWPLLVFWQYQQARPLSADQTLVAVGICYVLSEFIFQAIEQPFRGKRSRLGVPAVRFQTPAVACSIIITIFASSAYLQNGWPWRIDRQWQQAAIDFKSIDSKVAGRLGCKVFCEFGNPKGKKILVVGDSHIDHYTKALRDLGGQDYRFFLVYGPSCFLGAKTVSHPVPDLIADCKAANIKLHELLAHQKFDAIIRSQLWPGYKSTLYENGHMLKFDNLDSLFAKMLDEIGALYNGFDGPIVIVSHAPNTNTRCFFRPSIARKPCPETDLSSQEVFRRQFELFKKRTNLNVKLVRPVEVICPNDHCNKLDASGHVLYTDDIHLSVYGASLVVPRILMAIEHELASPTALRN